MHRIISGKTYCESIGTVSLLAKTNIEIYIPYVSDEYEKPKHLKPITDVLNRILNGEVLKVCFSVPPQHWKSVTVGHFLAKYLDKYRKHNTTYASYEQTFAESQTRLPKRLLKDIHGIKPIIDSQKEFVLEEGGSLFTTSTGGGMTGRPQNLIILDDLVKNSAEAESKVYRDRTYDWFFSAVDTRERENKTSLVLFMTRWHNDDLIGRLIKEKYDIVNIRIPALYDGLDCNGIPEEHTKELGTPLYYSKEFYEKKKRQNEYVFYGMYQGLPIQRGNSLFKDVNYYRELPNELKYKIGSDFAYSENTKSDYSVIVVFGYANKKHYLIDVIRYQKEVDYTENIVKRIKEKYKSKIGIEANGTQKAVYDMISKKIGKHYFTAVQPLGDKYTRAIPFASEWNLGNILLPDPTVYNYAWLDDYIEELMLFTGIKDANDDQVDGSVVAFNMKTNDGGGVYFA